MPSRYCVWQNDARRHSLSKSILKLYYFNRQASRQGGIRFNSRRAGIFQQHKIIYYTSRQAVQHLFIAHLISLLQRRFAARHAVVWRKTLCVRGKVRPSTIQLDLPAGGISKITITPISKRHAEKVVRSLEFVVCRLDRIHVQFSGIEAVMIISLYIKKKS